MMTPTKIVLFDLDGVLLKPGGYRASVHATMEYFLRQMGMEHANLQEKDIALLESMGVTSEWDMVPISLALVLDALLVTASTPPLLDSWLAAMQWAARVNHHRAERAPHIGRGTR